MTEAEARAALVREAESWLGTPYRSGADVKGAGVDCGMILVRSFVDTGVLPPFDPRPYPEQWHVNQSEERYMGWVLKMGHEITEEQIKPGDVVLFKYGQCFAHGAMVQEWPRIIHVRRPLPVIIEDMSRSVTLKRLPKRYFSAWAP
jgi:cell wall-associated NlpC family hydrolase